MHRRLASRLLGWRRRLKEMALPNAARLSPAADAPVPDRAAGGGLPGGAAAVADDAPAGTGPGPTPPPACGADARPSTAPDARAPGFDGAGPHPRGGRGETPPDRVLLDHDHHHNHHHHDHPDGHQHGHSGAAGLAARAPAFSLLRLSLAGRLAIAVVLLALQWIAVILVLG